MKWLSSKEVKKILKQLNEEYGASPELDYSFILNKEDKVFIIDRQIREIDISGLRINTIGLYIGRLVKNELKLSIEGSQLIGSLATKNVIELDDTQIQEWIRGFNIDLQGSHKGFVMIKNKSDYFGCGKHKEDKILNMVPKERRIVSLRKV